MDLLSKRLEPERCKKELFPRRLHVFYNLVEKLNPSEGAQVEFTGVIYQILRTIGEKDSVTFLPIIGCGSRSGLRFQGFS